MRRIPLADSPVPAGREPSTATRRWLTAGLAVPEVVDLHGDAGYLLRTMIATYIIAADTDAITVGALIARPC